MRNIIPDKGINIFPQTLHVLGFYSNSFNEYEV